MYPYVYVISKPAFEVLTKNGQDLSVLEANNFDYEIVHKNDLTEKLFGHVVVIQSHIFEVFEAEGKLTLDDIIVADPTVKEIPGHKEITLMLNESFKIIDIPFEYTLKVFIPENVELKPKRFEYVYNNIPLAFSYAVLLYKTAQTYFEESDTNEVVLLKVKRDTYGQS